MKTLEKRTNHVENKIYMNSMINKNKIEIKLISLQKTNDRFLLQIELNNLRGDNYCILLKGNYLTLIISDKKEISKPVYTRNIDSREFDQPGYEIVKSVDFWLPGDNFYVLKHYFVQADQLLNIYLSRIRSN